jgi:hypothetical protein
VPILNDKEECIMAKVTPKSMDQQDLVKKIAGELNEWLDGECGAKSSYERAKFLANRSLKSNLPPMDVNQLTSLIEEKAPVSPITNELIEQIGLVCGFDPDWIEVKKKKGPGPNI